MLVELAVSNYAIIDRLELEFAPGFTVLTGETGAGKSILIGAIQLLLGGRASADAVRTGEEEAVVEARFDLSAGPEVARLLEEGGFPADAELIVRRSVSRSGRGRCSINGRMAPVSLLKEIGTRLMNIYGQFEHQSLLAPDRHLELLDDFGGLVDRRGAVASLHAEAAGIVARLRELKQRDRDRAQREDYLRFVIGEIESAALEPDEQERLKERRAIIRSAERLRELTERGEAWLYADEGSVHERLARLAGELGDLAGIDADLKRAGEALAEAAILVEDARDRLADVAGRLEFDSGEQERIEQRLDRIHDLSRKYGDGVPAILDHLAACREELDGLTRSEEQAAALERDLAAVRGKLVAEAQALTAGRRKAAARLAKELARELATLEMKGARLEALVEPLAGQSAEELDLEGVRVGPRGADRVEFLLSANPGEEPRPMARIASGGELSRIMLAIKRVLHETTRVPTLVFDEVDAGIGGQVAEVVGEKLAGVAREHQVLVITHLPQIARWARQHYRVGKTTSGGRTRAGVQMLNETERVEEIARMLAGSRLTDRALAHAREMLDAARGAG